ncbi:MAG TPA: glycosyltransferase family 87 protein [Candidatus Dormibacteraeota bacterium]|nr:glycosyltransferase family 87 protein [Candidatus Dormibacteraeota bacterium]
MKQTRLPPLWLGASGAASFTAAAYSLGLWLTLFLSRPVHEDVRLTFVAAVAGLRYGWQSIYDEATLRSLSAAFPAGAQGIDPVYTYLNPPLLAWLFSPLTLFTEPVAYVAWTVLSLAVLAVAWYMAAPYAGFARLTLLPLAVGLWPVLLVLYFGQPTLLVLGLVAAAWWLTAREQQWAAGVALAFATFLKPQDVLLLPLVLLVSGRYRAVAGWGIGCGVLGIATAAALQPSGLQSWWHALQLGQAQAAHTEYTLAHFFGFGILTYALWVVQAAAAVAVAWSRKSDPSTVYAAGILGTVTVAFHFHELDYSLLVLGAWLFLRSAPPLWQRLALLPGIVTMQVMTYGPQATQPLWDVLTHAPQLLFDAGWLGILVAGAFGSDGRRVEDGLADARAAVAISVVEHPALAPNVADPGVAEHL